MKIRLSDADRERLGAPEILDASLDVFSVRDAEALETATGVEPGESLRLMQPVHEPIDEARIRFRFTPRGLRMLVWLGLHRAGVHVSFDELDFDFSPWAGWHEVTTSLGKADSPDDEPSTPSTSPTSGRRTRSKT